MRDHGWFDEERHGGALACNIWGVRSGMGKIRGPLGLALSLFEVGRHVLGPRIGGGQACKTGGRPTLIYLRTTTVRCCIKMKATARLQDPEMYDVDLVPPDLPRTTHRLSSLLGHSPSPSRVSSYVHAAWQSRRP